MKISTTYTPHPSSNVANIVARGIGGKQKTTRWDSEKSTDANHGIAAANLILHVQKVSPELQYGDNLPFYVVNSLDAGYGSHTSNESGTVHKFEV